jgi:molybdopterin-biosynthesis enzyme MoeA-like protein
MGVSIDQIYTIHNNREQLLSSLKSVEKSDVIIVVGTDNSKDNFNIKNAIADHLKFKMDRNLNAVKAVENYINFVKKSHIRDVENEFYMPSTAMCLDNSVSHLQGFATFRNNIIVFLPGDLESIKYLFNNSLFPIVTKELKVAYDSMTLKLFGIPEKDILINLKELLDENPDIIVNTLSENLETSLIIRYNMLIEKDRINNFVSKIYERLRKFIFTDEDTTLYQLALDLLTLHNSSLTICETITGGNISSELNKCISPAKHLINQSYVFNSQNAIIKNTDCNSQIINTHGLASVESTYELASSILEKNNTGMVLVTCGDLERDDHVCFIAVGDADGIHVYKNTCIGTRNQIVETVSKCAVFYLIKKLKQNDLFFNKIRV